jgi:hypothetical protein
MPRHPFSKLISQGHQVQVLHQTPKAALARTRHEHIDWFYVAKHGQHHGEGTTPAEAIAAVRAARAAWEASENQRIGIQDLRNAGMSQELAERFCMDHCISLHFFYTRAELRRVVTLPEYKAAARATYGDQLRALGIHLGK